MLARWSSRDEFTLNVTLFNRLPLHPEVGEIVGDFTSVSLLACSFDGTASFLRRARALQAQLWADMDHSTFSGVEVIREWSRCTGRSSADIIPIVFTSTIGFGDEHGTHPALRTFGRMVYNITQTPQVWIDHQVREVDDCLEFNWDAVDELFPEGLVDACSGCWPGTTGSGTRPICPCCRRNSWDAAARPTPRPGSSPMRAAGRWTAFLPVPCEMPPRPWPWRTAIFA